MRLLIYKLSFYLFLDYVYRLENLKLHLSKANKDFIFGGIFLRKFSIVILRSDIYELIHYFINKLEQYISCSKRLKDEE